MSLPRNSEDLNKLLNHTLSFALYSILALVAGHFLYQSDFIQKGKTGDLGNFETTLHAKEQRAHELLHELAAEIGAHDIHSVFDETYGPYEGLYEKEGILLFGYTNDSLAFWTNNSAPVDMTMDISSFHSRIMRLRNGWYEVASLDTLNNHYRALILIKREYPFENEYLVNSFQRDFKLSHLAEVELIESEEGHSIHSDSGDYLFSLTFNRKEKAPYWKYFLLVILNLAGIVFLFVFLHRFCNGLAKRIGELGSVAAFASIVLVLRYFSLQYFFPSAFGDLNLFDPTYYATSQFFPSLGDLLLNSLLLLIIAYYANRRLNSRNMKVMRAKTGQRVFVIMMFGVLYGYAWLITSLFRGMIKDSSINFDINNLFTLDWYSYVGLLIVGVLFLSFFILGNKLLGLAQRTGMKAQEVLLYFSAMTLLFVLLNHGVGRRDLILVLWPTAVMIVIIFSAFRNGLRYDFSTVITLLVIFSFFSSHTLSKYSTQKERENRVVFAEKLSSDQDPVTEYEYPSLETRMLQDEIVRAPFDSTSNFTKSDFDKKLQQQFFNGYWDRYEVRSYLFDRFQQPVGKTSNSRKRDYEQLEKTLALYGSRSDLSANLYYIHNSEERISYIIRLPLFEPGSNQAYGYIFIELASKLIPEEIGFPALLLDKNTKKIDDLTNYSYARYVDRRLINRSGVYNYPITLRIFESLRSETAFFEYDGYDHLFYIVDEGTMIILSRVDESALERVTAFSYLFAFFAILLLVVIFFNNFPQGLRVEHVGLGVKIQLLIVGVLLTSLILFVVGTRYYIEEKYKEKNNSLITEKIHSVQIEVLNKLGAESELDPNNKRLAADMEYYLQKFSRVFFTDINLYSLEGNLLASSRAKIFDEGLIGRKMSPAAYINLGLLEKSKYIHEEEIGGMRYLSAYVPFRNKNNEILAYLNLPYFAKQNELENEISGFLVAIINIFVLLFGFSLVAALFVSNWITKPLKLLQSSFANIELGKSNKIIEYEGLDEIGALVAAYNKTVLELEYNAQLLARSERESAWREMAKQVAHEIKNPLTPMKLRVQHLQMSYDKSDPDWEDRLKSFTDMLIEQIDTLTNIANEFSNFAKMPRANFERLDLAQIVNSTVELYQDTEHVEVKYHSDLPAERFVKADRDQVVRVFTNLVKNAIQAIPDHEEGKVRLMLSYSEGNYITEVRDNGIGIAEDQFDKIFVPNFTTKSTGTGLGLAMVKNIVETAGGKVWFESKVGKGSSFFVQLPVYDDEFNDS